MGFISPTSRLANLYIDTLGVLDFGGANVVFTHSAETLTVTGMTTFKFPATMALDWGAGDVTLTGGTNILTLAGGRLRVTTFGTVATPDIAGAGATGTGVTFAPDLLSFSSSGGLVGTMSSGSFNAYVLIQPNANGAVALGSAGIGWKAIYLDYTNTGTVGAVTINKPSGRVNIAAAGTSVVVTNNLVTAASKVVAWMSQADGTAGVTSVVPTAGSFTITTAAVTNQTSFDFLVINAD